MAGCGGGCDAHPQDPRIGSGTLRLRTRRCRRIGPARDGVRGAQTQPGGALWAALSGQPNLEVFCPARGGGHRAAGILGVPGGESSAAHIRYPADRRRRRCAFGGAPVCSAWESDVRDYGQTAVITTVLPQRFHDHVAYERFTRIGAARPAAARRRALHPGAQPWPARGWKRRSAGRMRNFSPRCSDVSASAWAGSSRWDGARRTR